MIRGIVTGLAALALVALVGTYVFVVAPGLGPEQEAGPVAATGDDASTSSAHAGDSGATDDASRTASPTATAPAGPFPGPGETFVGVFTKAGPHNFDDTEAFIEATGVTPAVHEFSAGWPHGSFDRRLFDDLAERGMMPVLAWEPWDYLAPAPRHEQADYQLADILDGRYDSYIRSWARGIADLDYPVAIRFAHEMNGDWYPWSEQVNGNAEGEYVRAYRHVHDIFTSSGADNVTWVWSPNVTYTGSLPFESYYPGDEYVDWFGIVGYYGTGSESFDQIFGDSLAALGRIADKPVIITEIGAPNMDGRQAEWVRDMFDSLPDHPSVIGFVWFEVENEANWRLVGHPEAARVFAEAAGEEERYAVTWGPGARPVSRAPR